MTIDHADWGEHADQALKIYGQRVPLARASSPLASQVAVTVAPLHTLQLVQAFTPDQPSWEIAVEANLPLNAGVTPFYQLAVVTFLGTVLATGWEDDFYGTSGNSASGITFTAGHGPVRGDAMTVDLINLDPVQTLTVSVVLSVTSHIYDRAFWQQSAYGSPAPNGFTNPSGNVVSGVLANIAPTIASGASTSRLLAVYRGRVLVSADNTTGATPLQVTLSDAIGNIAGTVDYLDQVVAAGQSLYLEVGLPARPVLLTLKNTGGAGNITPNVTIVTTEY